MSAGAARSTGMAHALGATWAVGAREYASFFRTPLGWVVASLLLFMSGLVLMAATLVPGAPASLREFFGLWWYLLVMLAPAVSMRLFSEELRTGTIEPLMSSPLSEAGVVLGKFGGALGFLLTCLVPTLLYVVVLMWLSRPDPGPIVAGYLGVALVGSLYLSVGTLASVLTGSQTLAFLGTLFGLIVAEFGARQGALRLGEPWAGVARALSVEGRVSDFARGVIDTDHVVFFVAASAFFLGISALVLRVRRWR